MFQAFKDAGFDLRYKQVEKGVYRLLWNDRRFRDHQFLEPFELAIFTKHESGWLCTTGSVFQTPFSYREPFKIRNAAIIDLMCDLSDDWLMQGLVAFREADAALERFKAEDGVEELSPRSQQMFMECAGSPALFLYLREIVFSSILNAVLCLDTSPFEYLYGLVGAWLDKANYYAGRRDRPVYFTSCGKNRIRLIKPSESGEDGIAEIELGLSGELTVSWQGWAENCGMEVPQLRDLVAATDWVSCDPQAPHSQWHRKYVKPLARIAKQLDFNKPCPATADLWFYCDEKHWIEMERTRHGISFTAFVWQDNQRMKGYNNIWPAGLPLDPVLAACEAQQRGVDVYPVDFSAGAETLGVYGTDVMFALLISLCKQYDIDFHWHTYGQDASPTSEELEFAVECANWRGLVYPEKWTYDLALSLCDRMRNLNHGKLAAELEVRLERRKDSAQEFAEQPGQSPALLQSSR